MGSGRTGAQAGVAMTFQLTVTTRPKCERHPTYKVWMDGSSKK